MINLAGEYIFTSDDIAHSLIDQCDTKYRLEVDPTTKMGFKLLTDKGILEKKSDTIHERTGMYAVWKDHHCLYTGKSDKSMGTRIGRWIKEIQRKSLHNENHPAARKYREMWGEDFSNMTVCVYRIKKQSDIPSKDIEKSLIRVLKPMLNVQGKK